MKKTIVLASPVLLALCLLRATCVVAQSVESMAPVVVKTVPQAGSTDVEPGELEVKITFSKEMMDQNWSWVDAWQGSPPPSVGKPKYSDDHRTCVVKVKLESGKTYGWWINSRSFGNFKDKQGRSAVPYLFVFKVK
jgi:Bacterial Ig-like domain